MEKSFRETIGVTVCQTYEWIKKQFDEEAFRYFQAYSHEFSGVISDKFFKGNRVDVNIVFPILKALIPNLYFKDPKVFAKSFQRKITRPVLTTDEQGNEVPVIDPMTGMPMMKEYDGVEAAKKFEAQINKNITDAKLKLATKDIIADAHLGFYGAVKLGWGNDQGVASMPGGDVPPSLYEGVGDNQAYVIRLKPWEVVVDMEDFYNPRWIALRHTVPVSQLKTDTRLQHTEGIEGKSLQQAIYKGSQSGPDLPEDMIKRVDYFEVFIKPNSEQPKGKYLIFTEEVKDKFLYESDWPYAAATFPVKLLYFNKNPLGGLPIPDVRLYIGQQKAKLNIRNAAYEFVLRTMPIIALSQAGITNIDKVSSQMSSGQVPRTVVVNAKVQDAIGGVSMPTLNPEFHRFDDLTDKDTARMTGFINGVLPNDSAFQFSSGLKEAAQGEQRRNNERADQVSDVIFDIIQFWKFLWFEFAPPESYVLLEGEEFPVPFSNEEIKGDFLFTLKPFSMNYEDPVIRRRQWQDTLNLLGSPVIRQALIQQGTDINIVKIVGEILDTFQEKNVSDYLIRQGLKPEDQVALAVQENRALTEGQSVPVNPTDNDTIHLIIHGLVGDVGLEHMMAHQQKQMQQMSGNSSPGGGNPESLGSVNGNAVSQEMLREPLNPSAMNQGIAINREGTR